MNKLSARIRDLIEAGATLTDVLSKTKANMHEAIKAQWAIETGKKVYPKKKVASYKEAIAWIADMDEGAELDPTVMAEVPTVLLVACLWGKEPIEVAEKVIKLRKKV